MGVAGSGWWLWAWGAWMAFAGLAVWSARLHLRGVWRTVWRLPGGIDDSREPTGYRLTPLGEALQIGAARLAVRRETRRILLAITDGRPGCEGGGCAALNHAQQIPPTGKYSGSADSAIVSWIKFWTS